MMNRPSEIRYAPHYREFHRAGKGVKEKKILNRPG
jgi:hypothetical protein